MANEYAKGMLAVLRREDIHPIAALAAAVDLFWEDMERAEDRDDIPFAWSPEALFLEIEDRLGGPVPPRTLSKLLAAVRIFTGNLGPFRSVHEFREMINILADEDAEPVTEDGALMFSPVEPEELVRGMWTMLQLARPMSPEDGDPRREFSEPVRRYQGWILDNYGYIGEDPPPLQGIPIREKAENPYGPIDDLATEVGRMQDVKRQDLEDALQQDLILLEQQLEALPLRHRSDGVGSGKPGPRG